MHESHPDDEAVAVVLSPEEQARQAEKAAFRADLNAMLRSHQLTFGDHSGSVWDRFAHGSHFVAFMLKQGGEDSALAQAFPPDVSPSQNGKPPRIISTEMRIFDLLKPWRDDNLALDRIKRDDTLQRARNYCDNHPAILYGLALHEAINSDTNMGDVTLDAVAALTLAVEEAQRTQKAS